MLYTICSFLWCLSNAYGLNTIWLVPFTSADFFFFLKKEISKNNQSLMASNVFFYGKILSHFEYQQNIQTIDTMWREDIYFTS